MSQMSNFNAQSVSELKAVYEELSKDLFRLKSELYMTRSLEKPQRLRQIKRDRARVLTALRAKGQILK
jgi:ribosomal protein L29